MPRVAVLAKGRRGIIGVMTDVTQILSQIESGDPSAAEQLLPLVYEELRKLAAAKLSNEKPGQTLQATALVHEAYLRLVDVDKAQHWDSRGHFFGAAAEAMRRILVESARQKDSVKRGGGLVRHDLDVAEAASSDGSEELLAVNDALDKLREADPLSADIVKLRYFAGLTMKEAAELLGVSPRTAHYAWAFARSWLRREMRGS
jgi:RNA polymerase sigma factor (TIGR02999 family)